MATAVNVYTGDGIEQGSIPDAGADGYFPSLSEMAALLGKACDHSSIFKRCIAIGDPADSASGIDLGSRVIAIPFDVADESGAPICIPLMMGAFKETGGYSDWRIVSAIFGDANLYPNSWNPGVGSSGRPILAVTIQLYTDGTAPTVTLKNASNGIGAVLYRFRGLLWFPRRNVSSAKAQIL